MGPLKRPAPETAALEETELYLKVPQFQNLSNDGQRTALLYYIETYLYH